MTRASYYPLVIQTIFLVVVAHHTWPNLWPDEPVHDMETRVVVILSLVVYFWAMAEYFFGHTLRQLWMLTEARFGTCAYIQCWIMWMWELILWGALLVFGTWFLVMSETALDAILNALALNYIVEIDDMVANHTTAVGGLNACQVPGNTVMPESNTEWTSCYKIYACLSVNFINQPILPLLWGLLWCHMIDGEVLNDNGDSVALIMVVAAFVLVLLTSGLSCSLVNMCCCCCNKDDGFESSTEETGAYNFGSSSMTSPNKPQN